MIVNKFNVVPNNPSAGVIVERHAAVKVPRGETYRRTVERVDRYLPANYRTVERFTDEGNRVLIVGRDLAGWTLEGYVIPRLASGLLFAEEYGGPNQ